MKLWGRQKKTAMSEKEIADLGYEFDPFPTVIK